MFGFTQCTTKGRDDRCHSRHRAAFHLDLFHPPPPTISSSPTMATSPPLMNADSLARCDEQAAYKRFRAMFEGRTIHYNVEQLTPFVHDYNLKNPKLSYPVAYDQALRHVIAAQGADGQVYQRLSAPRAIIVDVAEEDGNVEIVPHGGKGGTMRIVHPN